MGKLVRSVAAGRKASVLFKTLSKVEVSYNPFDPQSTTAREFLRRVRTTPVQKQNPELSVNVALVKDYGRPSITLTYVDGEKQALMPIGSTVVDLVDQIERVARWKGEGIKNPFDALRARDAASKV